MRILFSTVALPGHLYPLVPLAWACRSLGHDVLVTTSDSFVPAVARTGLPVAACGPAAGVADLLAGAGGRGLAERRSAHGRAFGRIAARNLPGIQALAQSWQPDLVVSERAEFAGPIVAAGCRIPQVEFHWGVPPLPEYRAGAAAELAGPLAAAGLAGLPDPIEAVNPWPPSLRLPHATSHLGLRYLPYSGDTVVPDWALRPRHRPRICLTLGTVLPHLGGNGGADFLLPVLHRLAALDVELVVAVDDEVAAGWPALPAAVRHAGRLPLSHVLGACDLVVNHGGQGSTLTAVAAGTPQLVLPQFDDQFDNADAVVRAGAGHRLLPAEVTPAAVAESCVELLRDPAYGRAAAAVAAESAAQPAAVDVVAMLEGVAAAARGRLVGGRRWRGPVPAELPAAA